MRVFFFFKWSALPSGLAHGLAPAGMWEPSAHFKTCARRCAGSLGWGEIKFKTCARRSRQRLSSRILMLLRTRGFSIPPLRLMGTSVLQTAGKGGRGNYPFLNCALW